MLDLAFVLGFDARRPERDTGIGPDVLLLRGELVFLVIDCKSGVITDFISRHDLAPLGHSLDWFGSKYDGACEPAGSWSTRAARPTRARRRGLAPGCSRSTVSPQ